MQENPLKIGIILNYKNAEKKKDELLNIRNRKMLWLALANDKKYNKFVITKNKKKFVPDDVAIGLFIESHYPEIQIDYIHPDEISVRRFKKNHINFVIIYDLLEAFHLSDKSKFANYKNALKKCNNVYPPYQYQKFINNKCLYYKYLSNKNIPVAPTHCITKEKWYTRDPEQYVNKLIAKIGRNKWEAVIAKPVYGQESIDFAKFSKCPSTSDGLSCRKKQINKYLSVRVPKYKSIVFQEYIPGFDKNNPEFRTFFINGEYKYCIVTHARTNGIQPVQEGGTFKLPDANYSYLKKLSQTVMDSLPKFDLPGNLRSPILTRIDIGSGLAGVPMTYFINEVEFVPSLYIEQIDNIKYPVIKEISESLIKVGMEYSSNKLPIPTIF
jgi:hypothetical protein